MLHYFFVDNLIHDLESLDGLLLCDANISLLQGHGAETEGRRYPVIKKDEVNVCSEVQTRAHVKYLLSK